jgi:hypothetical protein
MAKVSGLKLLGVGNNAKTVKGDGSEYLTAILYLTPSDYLCPLSNLAGCREGCLNTAGRGAFNSVQAARHRKTQMLLKLPDQFNQQLRADLDKFQKYCQRKGIQPVVRLNGTSDYNWKDIIVDYPAIQFYDYTKVYNRVAKNWPSNYHLTLSYSEANDAYRDNVVRYANDYGANMAVVFRDKNSIPKTFLGREVIDGDRDDLRFLDPSNVVVALYAKGKAKKDTTGFVVDHV